MKFLRLAARCLLWAALAAVIFLLLFQSRLIYYPRPYDKAALKDILQRGARQMEVQTSQGRQVAFYLPSRKNPAQPPGFLWLVFGGNGSLALDYSGETQGWDERFGYLFVDYPGYGLCEGRPNPARIEESIVKITQQLQTDLHWSDEDLRAKCGVFGHSLGCAAALIAADRLQLKRAVLCAPFTTMTDMARRTVGWPLCYLNRHRFDNIARLQSLSGGNFAARIFHGKEDEAIPVAMSRTLAEKFSKTIRLVEVPDAGHNDVISIASAGIGSAMRELVATPLR